MPHILYLTAAHDKGSPLDALVDEIRAIRKALNMLSKRATWAVDDNPAANSDDIFQYFTEHGADIRVFHYAGHSKQDALQMEGGGHIRGFAEMFGLQQKNNVQPLQLVFLNGCASAGMVKSLHAAGVGAVIATVCKIEDESARVFATTFYETWSSEGKNLADAFKMAVAAVHKMAEKADLPIEIKTVRDFGFDDAGEVAEIPWGLYLNSTLEEPAQKALLNWQLNPPVQLPPWVLGKETSTNSESLRKLAFEFGEQDADARKMMADTHCSELMALIIRLPWTVGTHLRRLFAVDKEQSPQQNQMARLREMMSGYKELTRFICYTAFSALWDDALRQKKLLHIDLSSILPGNRSEPVPDYIALLKKLYHELDLIPGDEIGLEANIKKMLDILEKEPGKTVYAFLERLKDALPTDTGLELSPDFIQNYAPQGGLDELCRRTEAYFAAMIKAALFLTEYTLFSVRAISVDKVRYFNLDQPFVHKTMTLHAAFSEIEPRPANRKTPGDNYSILLAPRSAGSSGDALEKALNLSPFYIDKHAMIGEKQDNYPAIYVLTNQLKAEDKATFTEENYYEYEYLDHDVNHQYLFESDHILQIAAYGLKQTVGQPLKPEEQRRFREICQQIEKLKTDFQSTS
jgi:hypothetical protein